jgi:hypothetical protein
LAVLPYQILRPQEILPYCGGPIVAGETLRPNAQPSHKTYESIDGGLTVTDRAERFMRQLPFLMVGEEALDGDEPRALASDARWTAQWRSSHLGAFECVCAA